MTATRNSCRSSGMPLTAVTSLFLPFVNLTFWTMEAANECEWETYQAALDNGAVALAGAQGQPYENEGADPVGEAGDAFPADRYQPADQDRGGM